MPQIDFINGSFIKLRNADNLGLQTIFFFFLPALMNTLPPSRTVVAVERSLGNGKGIDCCCLEKHPTASAKALKQRLHDYIQF